MRCCPQVAHSLWILCGLLPDPLEREHSRFCAQVHGIANDTIKFVQNIVNTEINSATDNPVSSPQKQEMSPRFLNERSLPFFLNGRSRWYLQNEERPSRGGTSTANTRLRCARLPGFRNLNLAP